MQPHYRSVLPAKAYFKSKTKGAFPKQKSAFLLNKIVSSSISPFLHHCQILFRAFQRSEILVRFLFDDKFSSTAFFPEKINNLFYRQYAFTQNGTFIIIIHLSPGL